MDLAVLLGISTRTVEKGRRGEGALAGLPFVRLSSRCVRYESEAVRRFIETRTSRAEEG